MADLENQLTLTGGKALGSHRNGILARRKIGEPVVADAIGVRFLAAHQSGARDDHVRVGHDSPGRILNNALQSTRCLLSHGTGDKKQNECTSPDK